MFSHDMNGRGHNTEDGTVQSQTASLSSTFLHQ